MDLLNWTVKWPLLVLRNYILNLGKLSVNITSSSAYLIIHFITRFICPKNLLNFLKSILFINSRTKGDSAHGDLISVRPTTAASNGRDVITEALTYIKENLLVLAFSSSPPAPPPRESNNFSLVKSLKINSKRHSKSNFNEMALLSIYNRELVTHLKEWKCFANQWVCRLLNDLTVENHLFHSNKTYKVFQSDHLWQK